MKIQKKLDAIVNFLRAHVRGGLIFLMAMLPMGGVPLARTFRSDEEDELREFIAPLLGKRNIYFGANPPQTPDQEEAIQGGHGFDEPPVGRYRSAAGRRS